MHPISTKFSTWMKDNSWAIFIGIILLATSQMIFRRPSLKIPLKKPMADIVFAPVAFKDAQRNAQYNHLNEYRGKVVILSIWASWCPPCRKEIPTLIELYKKYHDQGLEIIAINAEEAPAEAIENLEREQGYVMPFAHYSDLNHEVSSHLGAHSLPTNILISRSQVAIDAFHSVDWMSSKKQSQVIKLLEEPSPF